MNPPPIYAEPLFESKNGWTIMELVGYLSHRDASVAMGGAADFSTGGSLARLLRVCEDEVRGHGLSHFYVYNAEPDYWLGWRVPFGEAADAGTQRPGSPDVSLATETRKPGSLK